MADSNREKQTAVLNRVQAQRREQYQQKVFQAVTELRRQSKPVTPTNVSRVSGVSLSYLYKWEEIKDYIQSEREQDRKAPNQLIERELGPYSLRTLHEIARKRIQELEAEVKELKRQNQSLRGHVAEIYELRDERDRLRQRVLELANPEQGDTVVMLKRKAVSASQKLSDLPVEIVDALCQAGFELTIRLKREIKQHSTEAVLTAIEAFVQYRSQAVVEKPGACLLSMIHNEDEPNVSKQPTTPEQQEFDEWYVKAIQQGFVLDLPKNYLGVVGGEIQVKVKEFNTPGGYINMAWREAKRLMLESRF